VVEELQYCYNDASLEQKVTALPKVSKKRKSMFASTVTFYRNSAGLKLVLLARECE
jgi:hypothetical protein